MKSREIESRAANQTRVANQSSRMRNIIQASFRGTMMGGAVYISMNSERPVETIGVSSYLLTRNLLKKILEQKPFWAEALVESGLSVSLMVILDQVLIDAWRITWDIEAQVVKSLPLPDETINQFLKNFEDMKQMPELAVYVVLFLLLTFPVWIRGLKEVNQKS